MTSLETVRKTHVGAMRYTHKTIGHVIDTITQEQATTYRDANDGDKGWTTLEVLCHLRDFDTFFYLRAVMMAEQDYPRLPAYDHEQLAIERNYNHQNLRTVYTEYTTSRERTVAFFKGLTEEQWERSGIHPEKGHFTMTDAVMQVVTHDIVHTEQITRILAEAYMG